MRRRAEHLDLTLEQIDQTVRNRMEQADSVTKELLDQSHLQALALERLLSDLLETFEYVTRETGRSARNLIRRAHALNAGARAAAECLFLAAGDMHSAVGR